MKINLNIYYKNTVVNLETLKLYGRIKFKIITTKLFLFFHLAVWLLCDRALNFVTTETFSILGSFKAITWKNEMIDF